jgi:hypothetical protein
MKWLGCLGVLMLLQKLNPLHIQQDLEHNIYLKMNRHSAQSKTSVHDAANAQTTFTLAHHQEIDT